MGNLGINMNKFFLLNWTDVDENNICTALIRAFYDGYSEFQVVKYDWEKEEILQTYMITERTDYQQYQMAYQVFNTFREN